MAEVESYRSQVVVTYGFPWQEEVLDVVLDKQAQFLSRTDFALRMRNRSPFLTGRAEKEKRSTELFLR